MGLYKWIKRSATGIMLAAVMCLLSSSILLAGVSSGCDGMPSHSALTDALKNVMAAGENGGFGLNVWATIVNRDGEVCAVTFSGEDRGDQWPGSRVISAQKANTANAFSLPSLALSTANLYAAVQPGGSLYGLHTDIAYGGNAAFYGLPHDPMIGHKVGGISVFGGGLALYDEAGTLLGAVGISGDSSCTEHIIAWRVRDMLGLDFVPSGLSLTGDDNIVFDPTDGFGHPQCGLGEVGISATLPATIGANKAVDETVDETEEEESTQSAPAENDSTKNSPTKDDSDNVLPPLPTGGRIAVTNRGENTISLIDIASEDVLQIVLDKRSEPMYVQNPLNSDEIWIGDRGRSRVLVYDSLHLRQIAEIPAGRGVFHMWSHPSLGQMWVVNEIDKTLGVMSLETKKGIATVPIPDDLAKTHKPHDITMTPTHVIVSLLSDDKNESGWLLKISGKTYQEVDRLEVPADPRLMHWGLEESRLYVAAQAGKVLQIDPESFQITGELDIPGAHGIWANEAETYLYVSNIESADGRSSIYTIDIPTFQIVENSPADGALPAPHNLMVSIDNDKLFVTHNTDTESVAVFDLDKNGIPQKARTIKTGSTPFGIMLVRAPQITRE